MRSLTMGVITKRFLLRDFTKGRPDLRFSYHADHDMLNSMRQKKRSTKQSYSAFFRSVIEHERPRRNYQLARSPEPG